AAPGEKPETALIRDLEQIRDFNLEHRFGPLQMEIVSLETKYLAKILSGKISLPGLLNEKLAEIGNSFCVFFEVDTNPGNHGDLLEAARVLRNVRSPAGLKIRTGGERVPTTDELVSFISACRALDLRF